MSMEALRERMAELSDLTALARLAAWDQRTMMPPAGGPGRGEQLATLERLAHERGTADEVGEWLDALESAGLEGLDADIVQVARRDFDRARRVPGELAAEIERASSEGQDVWQAARAADDFAAFAPALRRRRYLQVGAFGGRSIGRTQHFGCWNGGSSPPPRAITVP